MSLLDRSRLVQCVGNGVSRDMAVNFAQKSALQRVCAPFLNGPPGASPASSSLKGHWPRSPQNWRMHTKPIPFDGPVSYLGPIDKAAGSPTKALNQTPCGHSLKKNGTTADFPPQCQPGRSLPEAPSRAMMSLPECAQEAGVSRRFLEKEILRGRLIARKLSPRICRVL